MRNLHQLIYVLISTFLANIAFANTPNIMVKIDPRYPQEAFKNGVNGWCQVAFNVNIDGTTSDVNAVQCMPSGIFEIAAVKAIQKWKYKPLLIDGQLVTSQLEELVVFGDQNKVWSDEMVKAKQLKVNTDIVVKSYQRQNQKLNDEKFEKTLKKVQCQLTNKNWAYLGSNCKNDLADGKGDSINRQGLKFSGEFKGGQRITGDIFQDGKMIFSGEFKNDLPDGSAICLFEDEYEECRFFRGKRIDTLYKIRKENAKNLAKMEELQKNNSKNRQVNSQSNQSNTIVNAIGDEASKRAATFIFDKLF